jgi:hypothetical protein
MYNKEYKLQHMYNYHSVTYYKLLIVYNWLPNDDWITQSKRVGGCVNKVQWLVKNKSKQSLFNITTDNFLSL